MTDLFRRPVLPVLACLSIAVVSPTVVGGDTTALAAPVSYDRTFPAVGYAGNATHNPVARLLEKLRRNELQLTASQPRGYVDSLLAALDIDASSQVLVFSRTSLQAAHISSRTPRAIYFNDNTYVAWVQDSDTFEVVTVDSERGPVFYTVRNVPTAPPVFEREGLRCLACHDSAGLRPGGVPRVLVRSSPIEEQMNPAGRTVPIEVSQATAVEERWGGWYVTGSLGTQLHLGNQPLYGSADALVRGIHNRSNLQSLQDHFDTSPYLSGKSDIVALLVLEHQSYIHNLLTRANFEMRGKVAPKATWQDVDAAGQTAMRKLLDPLVHAMTFQDEQRLFGRIRGGAGFEARFAARGPHDEVGRSLRDFELTKRTFKYPLSYLVYSEDFEALPLAAREYVYAEFANVLQKPSGDAELDADRAAALHILAATKPDFAPFARL
jgi:hypothetical protein